MAKAKLEELLGLPLPACSNEFSVLGEADTDLYRQISFEFQSEPGYFVPCELLIPNGAKGPLPVVVCLQGHSSGKHISMGICKYESDAEGMVQGQDFAAPWLRGRKPHTQRAGSLRAFLAFRLHREGAHDLPGHPGQALERRKIRLHPDELLPPAA